MNFKSVYQNIVKNCKTCNGTGLTDKTDRAVKFCHCMRFYIFCVRNVELGVPFYYVIQYEDCGEIKPGPHSFFKSEKNAFDYFMTCSTNRSCCILSSTEMYLLNDFKNLDVVLIYN